MTDEPGSFDADELTSTAQTTHDGPGRFAATLDEPLRIICHGLETTARLTPRARSFTRGFLLRLLGGHLAIDAETQTDPELSDETIVEPVFVVGAPRTGTTALHRLLGADPACRTPRGWEFLYPAPPPAPEISDDDPRITAAAEELGFPQSIRTELRAIHTYDARMPKECLSAMSFSFRSEEFISRYHLPEYAEWLSEQDLTPAYEAHRRVLQLLQRRQPTDRWVLKSPVHLQGIPELVATYADARFVVTHRDPLKILASVSSLIATLRGAFSDSVDRVAIGQYHTDLYAESLRRLGDHVDSGLLPVDRTAHITHTDLVSRPTTVLAAVYDQLGLPWTATVARDADAAAEAEREDGVGSHHYDPADFGLDPSAVEPRFADYHRRFLAPG